MEAQERLETIQIADVYGCFFRALWATAHQNGKVSGKMMYHLLTPSWLRNPVEFYMNEIEIGLLHSLDLYCRGRTLPERKGKNISVAIY